MSDIGIFKFGRNKVLWRLTPKNYIDTFRLLNYGGKFSVDWGDGTIIEYAANIGGAVVPTGIITITSDDDNLTRITVGRGVGENRAINAEVVYCGSMTSFEDSFRDQELTSFSINDTSGITNWDYAFENITELTSFPSNLDTSGGTSFDYAFARCTAITDFPAIDISSTTTLKNAWRNCSSLTSFPLIDTSAVTDFSGAWSDCGLTSFPLLDTGAGTNFSGAWRNCASLSSFPALDFSSGQIFSFAWKECAGLTSFPSSCGFTSATTMGGAFSESGLAS
ncbi:MAG: leucine-rich repeat protein, partial [Pontiella sp.]|nr:leucine-rich repeat protein [Pontiella sp.]